MPLGLGYEMKNNRDQIIFLNKDDEGDKGCFLNYLQFTKDGLEKLAHLYNIADKLEIVEVNKDILYSSVKFVALDSAVIKVMNDKVDQVEENGRSKSFIILITSEGSL